MATYTYKCPECGFLKNYSHSMKDKPEFECPECGQATMGKTIPKDFNFMLKGTNWSGKNAKEKNYRSKRRQEMGRRMAKSHDIPQIQPNYKGEVVNSWDDAKKLAKADGVDETRYSNQVENLQKQQEQVARKKEKLLRGEA